MAWMGIAQMAQGHWSGSAPNKVQFENRNNAQDKLDAMARRQEAMADPDALGTIDKAINAAQTGLPEGQNQQQVLDQLAAARKAEEERRRREDALRQQGATPAPSTYTRAE